MVLPLRPDFNGEYSPSASHFLKMITHYNNLSINQLYRKLLYLNIKPRKYICFFSLRTWSILNDKLITDIIYVHSKLIIIDDMECIIGSANICDRSLLGCRDLYDGCLNKIQTKVGKFCSTLRLQLFREFLGELDVNLINNSKFFNINEDNVGLMSATGLDLSDPCSDEFYKNVLLKFARFNTLVYKNVSFKIQH